MKINPKRLRQILANSFILITAVTFVGCTQVTGNKLPIKTAQPKIEIVQSVTDQPLVISEPIKIPEEVVQPVVISETADVPEEMVQSAIEETKQAETSSEATAIEPIYYFLDENIDLSCINNTTEYFCDNVEQLLSLTSLTREQQILAMYAYKKLITANIHPEVFEVELNNMMVEQIMPRGLDDEDWEKYFGNLVKTLNEEESLGDTYSTMAWLIHNQFCSEEHSYDNGVIKCKSLLNQFNNRYSK